MSFNVEVTEEDDASLLDTLNAGLAEHAAESDVDLTRWPIAASVRNDSGEVIAGLTGNVLGPYFHVARMWVAEHYRGVGLGRTLVEAAERRASQRGATVAYLATFGFQAPGFYERLGYTIFGRLEPSTSDHTRYFMKKSLRGAVP